MTSKMAKNHYRRFSSIFFDMIPLREHFFCQFLCGTDQADKLAERSAEQHYTTFHVHQRPCLTSLLEHAI